MGVQVGDNTVMAMSYYPNEANPLWGQYSTKAVAHTVDFIQSIHLIIHILLPFQLILIVWEWSIQWFPLMDIDQKKMVHILKEQKRINWSNYS